MSELDFDSGFRELTGNSPFPWQHELFTRFKNGSIDRSLDIPTGLGKTAVMAIWLLARASGAVLPRRLVYVVDRRAVVDQASDVAMEIRKAIDRNTELKHSLGLGERSLPISTLRGQHVDNKEWLEDPAGPAIIVGTVDMIGSRLLFEGYGTSRKMRPYHAGLLGADALIALDEAHLVPPFEKLLETIAECATAFGASDPTLQLLVPRFKLISLSATGRAHSGTSFGLQDADLKHPIVRRRLDAPKRLTITLLSDDSKLADALADEAWKLADNGTAALRIIVFCDKRKDAESAKASIVKLAKGDPKKGIVAVDIDTQLFVGGRRVFERENVAEWLRDRGFIPSTSAGAKVIPKRVAFVFATSAAEVGVDLDADHMACDLVAWEPQVLVGWERMVQRLGRVNRRGDGDAKVIVVVEPEPKPKKVVQDAIEKNPIDRTDKDLNAIAAFEASIKRARALKKPFELLASAAGWMDASPGALQKLKIDAEKDSNLQAILDAATTPAPLRPALSRALVDAWSMTSLKEHAGRPEIGPWLRGWIEADPPQTSLVWRTHLPIRKGWRVTGKDRRVIRKEIDEIEEFFEAAPPHPSEVLETEMFQVIEWLEQRGKVLLKLANSQKTSDITEAESCANCLERSDVAAIALNTAGEFRAALNLSNFIFDDEDDKANKKKKVELERQLSGATLVVDVRVAGLRDGLLHHESECTPRTVDDGAAWLTINHGDPVVRFRVRVGGEDSTPPAESERRWRERLRFATEQSDGDEPKRWLIVEKWLHDGATEDDRSTGHPQLLDIHQRWAICRSREIGTRLCLPNDYIEMLAIAARLHDEGKKAKRWQRAFNALEDGVYAKTCGPLNVALLDGYRHEFGSLPVAENDPGFLELPSHLKDLLLHLIAAHHGFARPIIAVRGCQDAPPSALEDRAREVALRFARLQKRWGPWGLAWWESVFRAADQQASRDNDAEDKSFAGKEVI